MLILGFSGWLMSQVPQQFFPGKAWPQLTMAVELPEGTPQARTAAVVAAIEKYLAEKYVPDFDEALASDKVAGVVPRQQRPGVVSWSAFVGQGAPRFVLGYAPEQPKEHYAYFVINAEHADFISEVIDDLSAFIREHFPEVLPRILPLRNGPPLQYPVEIRLRGDDPDTLEKIVGETENRLRAVDGLLRVGNNWGPQRPQVDVAIDPVRLKRAGLSHAEVARSLDTALRGRTVTVYRDGRDLLPIVLRRAGAASASLDQVKNVTMFRARDGKSIPLLEVADVGVGFDPPVIHRRDRQRTVTVRADISPSAPRAVTAFSVAHQLSAWLDEQAPAWPLGFGWEYGGEVESSGKADASIQAKQPIGLLIILFCLIFQFNTVREPVIVLLTLPFALTGVALGLYLTQKPFGFMALLGVIALVGIVINNAIVLLDRVQTEVASGLSKQEAILEASERRLRPILLTTATTVAGLIPLALSGGPLFSPMAVALMSGLVGGTLLTLGLVPVLYSIFHRLPRVVGPAAVLVLSTISIAEARPLSESEAAQRAIERSAEVDGARAELEQAAAVRAQTVARFFPRLDAQASYTRLSDLAQPSLFGGAGRLVVTERSSGPLTEDDLLPLPPTGVAFPVFLDVYALAGTLTVPLSRYVFELSSALSTVRAQEEAARIMVDLRKLQAATRARLSFQALVGATQQVNVFDKRVNEANERLRVAEQRRAAGRAAQTDVLEAESALARAELALTRAKSEVEVAEAELRSTLVDPPEDGYEVPVPEITATYPKTPDVPPPLPTLEREASRRRLELRNFEALVRSAQSREGLALASGAPRIELVGSILAANPNPRFIPNQDTFDTTWEVGGRLSWAPNDLWEAMEGRRQARAQTSRLVAQLDALRLDIRRELAAARATLVEAIASLASARSGLAAARQAYAQRKLTYKEGAATLLDLLQSESALLQAELDGVRASVLTRTAQIRLDHATGRNIGAELGR